MILEFLAEPRIRKIYVPCCLALSSETSDQMHATPLELT